MSPHYWVTRNGGTYHSQQSINKYENHNIEPDIETLIRIADYFQTSVDYLIGHSSQQHHQESSPEQRLSAGERMLISTYRGLTAKQKECVLLVAKSYQDQ